MEQANSDYLDYQGGRTRASRFGVPTRVGAFLIHLLISFALFIFLMYLIYFHWYSGPYFRFDGGWRGTLIMIGVDLVLGPTLTLIIFDPRKSAAKIRLDLAIIGFLQLAALVWGFHAVESQRPVAVSFFNGGLHPVTAQVVRDQGIDPEKLQGLHPQSPPLVYVEIPKDESGIERMSTMWTERGHRPHVQVALFRPLASHMDDVVRQQPPINRILHVNEAFRAEFEAFKTAHGEDSDRYVYATFNGRYGEVLFALDAEGRVVDWLTETFKGIL